MTTIQQDKEQEIYSNFINSINSDVTRLNYELHVNLFKKFCNLSNLSELLIIEEPQKHIINYILSLRQRGLASSSVSTMINAIYHFYDMNDVALNKKKIKMFIGQSPKKVTDRAYSDGEISRILNVSDMRMKAMVLLMATAGLRIGAIPQLRLRNLEKIDNIYKITVYEGSTEEYITFCTPECTSFINSYLEYRKQNGEKLDKDSFLIRDQLDITDLEQIRNKSKGLTVGSLEGILGTVLLKAGLRSVDHTYKWIRKEVPRAHGFRKFFTTQLINSDVNPEIREMLLGHKIGLTGCYYRPTEDKMYKEYLKAVDLLTINEENRLKRELEQKIQIEKSQIESLKADFEKQKKFDSIVDPSKGIKKIIISMIRQPITIFDKQGKAEVKDALYYNVQYYGVDKRDTEIGAPFHEGSYKKPKLSFAFIDPAHPYDSTTGERRGRYVVNGYTFEHYIILPEDKKERRKQLEDIIQKATGTYKGNLENGHLHFRNPTPENNHTGAHGGSFNWNQFCDLSIEELGEAQNKRYYKEASTGILKDKDGVRVEWNKSTGKLKAIK